MSKSRLWVNIEVARFARNGWLDRVANPHGVRIISRGLPVPNSHAFAHHGSAGFRAFVIDYAPGKWLLESKSLKLYLASFRNVGRFMRIARLQSENGSQNDRTKMAAHWRLLYPRGGFHRRILQQGKFPAGYWRPIRVLRLIVDADDAHAISRACRTQSDRKQTLHLFNGTMLGRRKARDPGLDAFR